MQLTYRGARYDYAPHPIPKFGSVLAVGSYRGAPVAFRAVEDIPEQASFALKWRGIPYRSGSKTDGVASTVPAVASEPDSTPASTAATPKLSIVERSRALFIRRHRKLRQREQSMLARLDEEVGRSAEDATHYESHIQGKVPHDFADYDRSNTAMS